MQDSGRIDPGWVDIIAPPLPPAGPDAWPWAALALILLFAVASACGYLYLRRRPGYRLWCLRRSLKASAIDPREASRRLRREWSGRAAPIPSAGPGRDLRARLDRYAFGAEPPAARQVEALIDVLRHELRQGRWN